MSRQAEVESRDGAITMADQEAVRIAMESWKWARRQALDIGGCLTFTRGPGLEQVLLAYGMDPGDAQLLPYSRAREALHSPVVDERHHTVAPWVRIGRQGEWTFGIEEVSGIGFLERVGERLSVGTESIVVLWTAKPNWEFACYVDGARGTSFDIGMAWYRRGNDPDRFLAEMRQVGLETAPPPVPAPEREYRDPVLQSLAVLTLALGIRVPEEAAQGPLLTCQRRPDRPATEKKSWRTHTAERDREIEEWAARRGIPVVDHRIQLSDDDEPSPD